MRVCKLSLVIFSCYQWGKTVGECCVCVAINLENVIHTGGYLRIWRYLKHVCWDSGILVGHRLVVAGGACNFMHLVPFLGWWKDIGIWRLAVFWCLHGHFSLGNRQISTLPATKRNLGIAVGLEHRYQDRKGADRIGERLQDLDSALAQRNMRGRWGKPWKNPLVGLVWFVGCLLGCLVGWYG